MSEDYIKRSDAMRVMRDWCGDASYNHGCGIDCECRTLDDMNAIPAEDVVRVTRCGKCWYGRSVMDGDMIECHFHTDDLGRPLLVYRDPDWFCGSGEPPEEDEKQTTMPDTDGER